jgi:hypothetical protein
MADRKSSPREIFLGVLLGIAVIWAIWFLTKGDIAQFGKDNGDEGSEAALSASAPRIRMDLLSSESEPYDPKGRDLFKYAHRPPTQAELDASAARKVAAARKPPPKPVREPPKVRPPVRETGPRPPRITFEYIGRIGPRGDHMAVFADGEELILARVGEAVLEKFRVVDIEYETVVMGYTDERFEKLTKTLNQTK